MPLEQFCTKSSCFFCLMTEPDSSARRATIKEYLKGVPFLDDEELILVVSGLWNVAMTRPDDEELPPLGIFQCMADLINRAIHDRTWLLIHQNIYIPYYAAHIIGSYTMNKVDFAVKAVESGVIPPLLELLRGKMSWVEQRVAIRALGHLASYERTFAPLAVYEDEVVTLAMNLASSCLEQVYSMFVGVKDRRKRLKYHCDLLTRGVGGVETENRKAEEWASQLQCWSIHLLNCFAVKERSISLICKQEFLKELSEMWGGLVNHSSPAGVGLIRILCYSKVGRENISKSRYVVENLCKLSRSSDDWQYMGIDCLLLLLKDPDTSNRARCNLLLRDPDSAISDATRALCLSSPPNSHANSLWTRSQAYDMKGMAKESLMDCILFVNVCIRSKVDDRVKLPYYAVRMISQQMDSTWLFRAAQLKALSKQPEKAKEPNENSKSSTRGHINADMMRTQVQNKSYISALSTILEEPFAGKDGSGRKMMERGEARNKSL
ncbi:hypothetical protein Sango_2110400 [Sesamum angolense]|uniref:ARM repeat N-terminal plant domain-containing protein n=1 Tax=Sesamum angolense TaxID=2727404 RepID=A0AAE2BM45_9LAMI|nr:hypothetical protein Sango_2110400 [Sesamum angolense]